jgi:hypothetical protein
MAPVPPTVGAKSEDALRRRVRPLWAGLGYQSRGIESLYGPDEVGHERVGREELTDLVLQLVALRTSPGYKACIARCSVRTTLMVRPAAASCAMEVRVLMWAFSIYIYVQITPVECRAKACYLHTSTPERVRY